MPEEGRLTILTITGPFEFWNNHLTLNDARMIMRDFKHYKVNGGNSFFEYSFEKAEFMVDFATIISIVYAKYS